MAGRRLAVANMLISIYILMFSLYCIISSSSIYLATSPQNPQISKIFNINAESYYINVSAILNHVKYFSNCGSRVTGYPGNILAADYIIRVFNETRLKVFIQKFNVTVPVDEGATITLENGETINAYALWPNGAQTCSVHDLEGSLIYIGGKELSDFDGFQLDGSIVLMDFNSGDKWLFAAEMGACAVIFIEPYQTFDFEVFNKFTEAPFNFPRLYIDRENGEKLMKLTNNGQLSKVKISSKMVWRNVEAFNIIGVIDGSSRPNDVIVVSSHYDSWSVVPKISYAASDALGVSFLLELAKYFSRNKPDRTIWFVAFSGFWQGLAGVREFIEEKYFSTEVQSDVIKPWFFIGLGPFSPDTNNLQLLCISYFCGAGSANERLGDRYSWMRGVIWNNYLTDPSLTSIIENLTGQAPRTLITDRLVHSMWWGSTQWPILLESEVVHTTTSIAFNILSSPLLSYQRNLGIPLNDEERVLNVQAAKFLEPQFIMAKAIVEGLANHQGDYGISWDVVKPTRSAYSGYAWSPQRAAGFITVKGTVLCFNYTKGWYDKIPNAVVRLYPLSLYNPFSYLTAISDENGSFIFHGIPAFTLTYARGGYRVEAYVLNETDNNIIYAPDMGVYGGSVFSPIIYPLSEVSSVSIVLARLKPIEIFSVLDPRNLRPFQLFDPRMRSTVIGDLFVSSGGMFFPINFRTKGVHLEFGLKFNPWEKVAIAFVPEKLESTLLFYVGGIGEPGLKWPIFISNSSENNPEGKGLLAVDGLIRLKFSAYRSALDMYLTAKERYRKLRDSNIRSLSIENYLNEAAQHLDLSAKYYKDKIYSKSYAHALLAYSTAYRAYDETMGLIDGSATATLFAIVLVVFSSLLLERLIFNIQHGTIRLTVIFVIASILLIFLSVFHPAFAIMNNIVMGIFGIGVEIITTFALIILLIETEKVLREVSVEILGMHTVERGKIGLVELATSLSVGFARKRPFRTTLTLLTVFITVASLISISSTSYYTSVRYTGFLNPSNLLYEEQIFLVKARGQSISSLLTDDFVNTLNYWVGDKFNVLPRAVYYPQVIYREGMVHLEMRSEKGSSIAIRSIFGITAAESEYLYRIAPANVTELGRWFFDTDYFTCILSSEQAMLLNVTVNDIIYINGLKLHVVGVLDQSMLSLIMEPNTYQYGPLDPIYIGVLSKDLTIPVGSMAYIPRCPWRATLIVPLKLAKDIGGYISSVALVPRNKVDAEEIIKLCKHISFAFDLDVIYSSENNSLSFSRKVEYLFIRYESLLIILAIAALNVAITIVSNISERKRDIMAMATLGLSPLGLLSQIILESLFYAMIGATIGYLAGFGLNALLIQVGIIPSDTPFNYASTLTMFSLMVTLLFVFVASIFPALQSSRIVTPSLKRRWELPTKPIGDTWEIPIPLRITERNEALGFLKYLIEYLEGAGNIGKTYIVDKISEIIESEDKLYFEVEIRLAPFEFLTSSHVTISFQKTQETYFLNLILVRTFGEKRTWISSSFFFIDNLRKQSLLWRSLKPQERSKYLK
jgi:ABC-type antimicrobial peptide transport system permease subunit